MSMRVLTNKQIEKILNSESKRFRQIIKTIKYIYQSKSSEKIKSLLSQNVNKDPSFIMKLIWELIKYFVIANELINIRVELFNMMFNKHSRRLSESELMRIINNPSNQWLDNNHKKIGLVSYFLGELLNSSYVCREVCRISKCSRDEYYELCSNVINKLKNIEFSAFEEFEKTEIARMNEDRYKITRNCFYLSEEEVRHRQELYTQSYGNSTLLDIVEEED